MMMMSRCITHRYIFYVIKVKKKGGIFFVFFLGIYEEKNNAFLTNTNRP